MDGKTAAAERQSRGQMIQAAAQAQASGDLEKAIKLLSEVLAETTLATDQRAQLLNDRGMAFARRGEFQAAFEDFNASARLYPENATLYNNRGAVLLKLGLVGEAEKDLTRAVALSPKYAAAYANRARVRALDGRALVALRDFRRAVEVDETASAPLVSRAALWLDLDRPHAAMRDLDAAIERNARDRSAFLLRARARRQLDETKGEIEDLTRLLAFDEGDTDALFARGVAHLRAGDGKAALADLNAVLEKRPDDAAALRERGHAHVLLEKFSDAEADFDQSLRIEPRAPEAFAYRALMYKKMAKPQSGVREIQTAEQFGPRDAKVLWARGEIAEALGDEANAIKSYKAALEADASLQAARFGLARLGIDISSDRERVVVPVDDSGWEIIERDGRVFARNTGLAKLRVPIEPVDGAVPEIVSWDVRSVGDSNFGVLIYALGALSESGGSGEAARKATIEDAALIQTDRVQLMATVAHRVGEDVSEWSWQEDTVKIAAVDGTTETISLVRKPTVVASPRSRSRRRVRRRSGIQSDTPAWAPWAENNRRSYRRSATRKRRRRRKQKTLVDLLFGN